jgi:hypothetical protein
MFTDYLGEHAKQMNENANTQKSVNGLNNYVREFFTKKYWLHEVYEFRTTIIHQLTREDILAIGNRIRGARLYVLQQYRELQSTEALNNPRWTSASAPPPWLEDVQQRLAQMVKICLTRGFDINPIPATHAH